MSYVIQVDAKALLQGVKNIQQKQIPFSMAKTLTDLAKAGQTVSRKRTKEVFKLHGEFIPNQILITPARVSEVKLGVGFSEIRTTSKIDFMNIHEPGGIRRPKGKSIAVPTFLAQRTISNLRNARGAIRPQFKPTRVLRSDKGFINQGQIYLRQGKKGKYSGAAKPLFLFQDRVTIKPEWKFESTIRERVVRIAHETFIRNYIQAIRSAVNG